MRITYYVAASLDGYIAKAGGDVAWLDELEIPPEETGYEAFFSTVDALVMGRRTFEVVHQFGTWPYGSKPVWVCARHDVATIDGANLQEATTPTDVVKAARGMGCKHLWLVGGGALAASFVEESLLTNVSLSLMPIVLGDGIRLFGPLAAPHRRLTLERCDAKPAGFLQVEYSL